MMNCKDKYLNSTSNIFTNYRTSKISSELKHLKAKPAIISRDQFIEQSMDWFIYWTKDWSMD